MVIVPGIEKQECLHPFRIPRRLKLKQSRIEREKSAGDGWFNMPRVDASAEMKRDLMLLRMRNALDTKRFYKKHDKNLPKYAQIGTVIETVADYYTDRVPKKERKNTIVQELAEDSEFKKKLKKRYVHTLQTSSYFITKKIRRERKMRLQKKKKHLAEGFKHANKRTNDQASGRETSGDADGGFQAKRRSSKGQGNDKGTKRHAKRLKKHKK